MEEFVCIPESASVLVVEDDQARRRWFAKQLPQAEFATTAEHALFKLSTQSYDFLFIDCDLDWKDSLPGRVQGGIRVAAGIQRLGLASKIVIHSANEEGALKMKKFLPQATLCPFWLLTNSPLSGGRRS